MEDPTGQHELLKAVSGKHYACNMYFEFHLGLRLKYWFKKVMRNSTVLIYKTDVGGDCRRESSVLLLATIVENNILGFQHKEVADKYIEYLQSKVKVVVTFEPKKFVSIKLDFNVNTAFCISVSASTSSRSCKNLVSTAKTPTLIVQRPDGTKVAGNQIVAHVDSSWANAELDFNMKSQYGYAIQLN